MVKLSELLAEVSAVDAAMTKAASKRPASKIEQLASALDKIAEEIGSDESEKHEEDESASEEKKEEDSEKEEKEASMKLSDSDIAKIAKVVVKSLEKIAVDSGPNTQGSVVNEGAKPSDGLVMSEARATDQIIDGGSVQSDAEGKAEANTPKNTNADLIRDSDVNNVGNEPPPLKAASVVYTAKEAQLLQKLAGIGYEYLVEVNANKIVNEKIAAAVAEKRASLATEKIANAIVAKEAGAMDAIGGALGGAKNAIMEIVQKLMGQGIPEAQAVQMAEQMAGGAGAGASALPSALGKAASVKQKLASIASKDPELFKAIHTLSKRNLL